MKVWDETKKSEDFPLRYMRLNKIADIIPGLPYTEGMYDTPIDIV